MKKGIVLFLSVVLAFGFLIPAKAENGTAQQELNYSSSGITDKMKDGNNRTYTSVDGFTYSGGAVKYIYIVFWDEPCAFTVESNGKTQEFDAGYLHFNAELETVSGEFEVTFRQSAKISEVKFYGEGDLPKEVQCWQNNDTVADLLLMSTHADDEQLFFAGILPYYATERGYRVQVVYFTDHKNEIYRRHELLDGLWTVGVRRYPVISDFPDMWSETYDGALSNLKKSGFSEEDVYAFQVEILRRFKPLVLVEHDLSGEYKHGQHIMNANCMTKSVEFAADSAAYPDSCEKYGAWNTPKMYVHLYDQNAVSVDFIDVPTEKLGGKSPFQITQEGFLCHHSQQYTWFKPWLYGKSGQISKASQIDKYSPLKYGLYRTAVGEDVQKNDFFENLVNYDEQERIAKEKAEAEEKAKIEAEKKQSKPKHKKKSVFVPVLLTLLILLFAWIAFVAAVKSVRKKRRKRMKRS